MCTNAGRAHLHTLNRSVESFLRAGVAVAVLAYDNVSSAAMPSMPWFARLHAYAAIPPGTRKLDACLRHVPSFRRFERVWLPDADLVPSSAEAIRRVISSARMHGAIIATPAVQGSSHVHMRPMQGCAIRHTDFVETMAPLVMTRYADVIYELQSSRESDEPWGPDMVWCKLLAHLFHAKVPCLIHDGAYFVHAQEHRIGARYNTAQALGVMKCFTRAGGVYASFVTELESTCVVPAAVQAALPRRPRTHELRLFVHNISDSACAATTIASNNFLWETQLEPLLRRVFTTVSDPRDANIFYVPACMSMHWSTLWDLPKTVQLARLQAYAARIVAELHPVWNEQPTRHIVPRMRCPRVREEFDRIADSTHGLWNSRHVIYACIETTARAEMDQTRAMHVPYYVPDAEVVHGNDGGDVATRRRTERFYFAGSACCGRQRVLQELGIVPSVRAEQHLKVNVSHTGNLTRLKTARFALQLAGDTPERLNMYQAWAAGTPVLWTHAVRPPLHLREWGQGLGWRVGTDGATFSRAPFLHKVTVIERFYTQAMRELATSRRPLLWHTAEFDAAFLAMATQLLPTSLL